MAMNNLKAIRNEHGLTMMELAKKSGVSRYTISILEGQSVLKARSSTLTKLADALGATIADFTKETSTFQDEISLLREINCNVQDIKVEIMWKSLCEDEDNYLGDSIFDVDNRLECWAVMPSLDSFGWYESLDEYHKKVLRLWINDRISYLKEIKAEAEGKALDPVLGLQKLRG